MAYRRRHGISRSSTFKEELYRPPDDKTTTSAPSSPLASQIRTSDAHRDSSLSNSAFNTSLQRRSKELSDQKVQGGTLTINVDKKSHDIQDASKLQNKIKSEATDRKELDTEKQSQSQPQEQEPETPTNHEDQLKASRDVAIATAAKAKLLFREIKTVKADLAFAKQRSSQLEEENKILREAREKGDHPADDDMIRLQLETLLAEKARLANENSVYVRENSCLREVIEYHKLSMQEVVYLDEGIEEVAEVNPRVSRTLSAPPFPSSPQNNSFTTKETEFQEGSRRRANLN
ncbi:uncharacterized protein LOC122194411 [Lactuca sativa]|uniref:uncharacterized protein LOC122194411 n=1 Tax=Lactuca sativa TaxID=4236 RepID=UPI000CC1B053|nr:uncharacterized protein LOC122194411 [Lactuca sativa]